MVKGFGGQGPANIMKQIQGIDFPVDKRQLLERAKQAMGPEISEVVETLQHLPDRTYDSPADVLKEISKVV